jgi:hypothetical protein
MPGLIRKDHDNDRMGIHRLRPSHVVTAADWIGPRLGRFGSGVGGVIPSGFEAYARILHPASDPAHELVRWGDVAEAAGAVEHPLMQFHSLVGLAEPAYQIKTPLWTGSSPSAGDLEPDSLEALLDVLGRHTETPSECWFCLWEGYGWINASQRRHIDLPQRAYLLYEGPLGAALEMGHSPTPEWFLPQSPNIFWPADQAWCVATEIDLPYTYVGGSRDLIDELLIDVRLEVWESQLTDPVAYDTDELNR